MNYSTFFKKKDILITGGAGFIGSNLAKKLVSLGAHVSIIDNFSRGSWKNISEIRDKITVYNADLCNFKESQKYFKKAEVIFNLAALNTGVDYDAGRTEIMFEENMLLQMLPLKMAKGNKNLKKFIQVSSASVYSTKAMDEEVPTPETADTSYPEESKLGYALAKKMGEYLANWYNKNSSFNTCTVRFINVYGENDHFDELGHFIPVMIKKFINAKKSVTVFGSGKQKRSFMHVDDAVEALLVLAKNGEAGEIYNADSNYEKSVKEVVKMIESYFKEKNLTIAFDISKPEGSQRRMLDSKKLLKLGWKPKVAFKEGLKRTIEDIQSRIT